MELDNNSDTVHSTPSQVKINIENSVLEIDNVTEELFEKIALNSLYNENIINFLNDEHLIDIKKVYTKMKKSKKMLKQCTQYMIQILSILFKDMKETIYSDVYH